MASKEEGRVLYRLSRYEWIAGVWHNSSVRWGEPFRPQKILGRLYH